MLDALGVERPAPAPPPTVSHEARRVLAVLVDGPASLDELSRATGLGSPEVAVALTELELAGLAEGGDGLYRAAAGAQALRDEARSGRRSGPALQDPGRDRSL